MTVEVVFQKVETVLIVKIVEVGDNKRQGLQYGTYVCDIIQVCVVIPCLFAPLRRPFTQAVSVPGTSVSFVRHSYPYP